MTSLAPRVALVAPLRPFRGGIAQHATEFRRALAARTELLTVSYSSLYPRWLYPGASDREPGAEGHREPGVWYGLGSLNPITWIVALRRILAHGPACVILVWWTAFLAPALTFVARGLARNRVPVVIFCQNVMDHERSPVKRWLARRLLRLGSAFVVQSSASADELRTVVPGARVEMCPHPVFQDIPPATRPLPRRARIELLFFGLVRSYKGLDVLADAMSRLGDEDVFLTVAGEWWMKDDALRERLLASGRVEILDRYIPLDEAAALFERADAVVLPYREASGSGVIPFAYRLGRPVIASRAGGLPDAVEDGVSGMLVPVGDAAALAAAVRRLPAEGPALREGVRAVSLKMGWDGLVEKVLRAGGIPSGQTGV